MTFDRFGSKYFDLGGTFFLLLGSGRGSHLWVWKNSPKNTKFSNFSLRIKKILIELGQKIPLARPYESRTLHERETTSTKVNLVRCQRTWSDIQSLLDRSRIQLSNRSTVLWTLGSTNQWRSPEVTSRWCHFGPIRQCQHDLVQSKDDTQRQLKDFRVL